jgi:hypothetical protein
MTQGEAKKENYFQQHSWKVLLIISGILGLFGIGDMIQGMSADPAIANSMTGVPWEELQKSSPKIANLIDLQVRSGGAQLLTLSILSIIICLTGYRRGERWAWYAFCSYPLYMVLAFIIFLTADRQADFPPPPPMLSAPVFFVICVLVLLLSYRRFSPLTAKKG